MDRRKILKTISGAVPVSLSLSGCTGDGGDETNETTPTDDDETPTDSTQSPGGDSSPRTTATTQGDEDDAAASVYVYRVENGTDRRTAIETLLEGFDTDFAGQRVAIKANFNSADPFPASTHPETLATLFDGIGTEADVVFAERSGMGDTATVLEETGVLELAEERGVETVVLDDLDAEQWRRMDATDSHWRDGFPFPDVFADADAVVQTCCLKTHRYGGHFTMSLKNSVGMVAETDPGTGHDYMAELHGADQREKIAEVNAAYDPEFVVMDGIAGFATGGPARGERIEPGIVAASRDRIALDAVGVAVLRGYDTREVVAEGSIFEQDQIARAGELGLGVTSPEDVRVVPVNDGAEKVAETITERLRS
jgi:uncharacterized protein (DUF362 family)